MVSDFRVYIRDCLQHIDMKSFIPFPFPWHSSVRLHSNRRLEGGGLMQIYIMNERPTIVAGAIFITPLVPMNPESATPWKMFLARVLYYMIPKLSLGYIDPEAISTVDEQVANYINDPLIYHGPVTVKFAFEVLNSLSKIEKNFPNHRHTFANNPQPDTLSDIRGSYIMYGKVASTDKTFKTFQNAFHELHHERPSIVAELLELLKKWLVERLPPENDPN